LKPALIFEMWGWCECLLAGVKLAKVYCISGKDCQIGTAAVFWGVSAENVLKGHQKLLGF
jgi:hypothetical protein